jgi:hypothetical protein
MSEVYNCRHLGLGPGKSTGRAVVCQHITERRRLPLTIVKGTGGGVHEGLGSDDGVRCPKIQVRWCSLLRPGFLSSLPQ